VLFFGIDPGTVITGYGVISSSGNIINYEDAGIIRTTPGTSLTEKLEVIYDSLIEKINEIQPDCICVEQAFYAKNVHTTLVLGHARGVVLLAAKKCNAEIMEFTPREIKQAIVGNGNAAKDQVEYMVKIILGLGQRKVSSDMYDALAAAICAFYHSKDRKKFYV